MKSHSDIECYFIENHPTPASSPRLIDDTLYVPGIESWENIIRKTLDSIEFFTARSHYDYVVRANLSSVWIFPRLIRYLESAPKERLYGGEVNRNMPIPHPIDYVSGAGILFSSDVCQLILQNRDIVYESNVIDDVDIGYALDKLQVPPTDVYRVNVYGPDDIERGGMYYRFRVFEDRDREPELMTHVLSLEGHSNSD